MLLTIVMHLDCCGNAYQIRRTQTLETIETIFHFSQIILLLFLLSPYYYDNDLSTGLYLLYLCQSHSQNVNVMAVNFVWLWMTLLLDQHQNGLEWLALVVLLVVTGLVLVLLLGQGGHVLMEIVGGVHTRLVTTTNSIFFMMIIIIILLLLLSFHYGCDCGLW